MDTQELEAGDTVYLSAIDVDGRVSAAIGFPKLHSDFFVLLGVEN